MRLISAEQLERCPQPPAMGVPASSAVRCTIAGVVVDIHSNVAGVIDAFAGRYADHRIDVSDRPADAVYRIEEDDVGYVFSRDGGSAWIWRHGELPPGAVAFLADAALMSSLIRSDPALASIHAAAVWWNRRAAAIAGSSTAGKTTTLLACARHGMRVYSDERALLRNGVVQPFLRRCAVREGGRSRLLQDDDRDRLALALQADQTFSLRATFGDGAVAPPQRLTALFVIAGFADTPRVESMSAAETLPCIGRWFDAAGSRMERLARALALLQTLRCFRVLLGTPAESAHAISRSMNGDY